MVATATHVSILLIQVGSGFLTFMILKWNIHSVIKFSGLVSSGLSFLFISDLNLLIHSQPVRLPSNSWYSVLWKPSIIKLNPHLEFFFFFAVRGPLTVVASPVAEHRLRTRRLSGHGSRAQPLRSIWDLPGPGHEPVCPASAGGLSTTAPPGKPSVAFWKVLI